MKKAAREARLATSWVTPNEAYEERIEDVVRGTLGSEEAMKVLRGLVAHIAPYGASNSLAQVALRLAAPGVPDVYQGNELWDFSLVDPDNRRPVDFVRRRVLLSELAKRPASPELASELLDTFADGRVKLHVTASGLRLRRERPQLFLEGSYEPLHPAAPHVVAFERRFGKTRLVCVVPRFTRTLTQGDRPWALGDVWGDRKLGLAVGGRFRQVFTGASVEGSDLLLKDVFALFPVAWLLEEAAP
jgi:(1->4)-alpha-D-glucan 1-alpha-D-glucosylmutase